MKNKKRKKYIVPKVNIIEIKKEAQIEASSGCSTCCPYVYAYDGSEYIKENNILPDSENLLRPEKIVEDYYILQTAFSLDEKCVRIKIRENQNEVSFFKDFKLIAVEHPLNYNIGVASNRKFISYKKPTLPENCWDQNGKNCLELVRNTDWRYPERFFVGNPGDYFELEFGRIETDYLKFILVDPIEKDEEIRLAKDSIYVYLYINGTPYKIAIFHSREEFYPHIIDLSPYISQIKGKLKLKLEFSRKHKIAFVGIDISRPLKLKSHVIHPDNVFHNRLGNIKKEGGQNFSHFLSLYPEEEIKLSFQKPKVTNLSNKLTYILYSKGYYMPISKMFPLSRSLKPSSVIAT